MNHAERRRLLAEAQEERESLEDTLAYDDRVCFDCEEALWECRCEPEPYNSHHAEIDRQAEERMFEDLLLEELERERLIENMNELDEYEPYEEPWEEP